MKTIGYIFLISITLLLTQCGEQSSNEKKPQVVTPESQGISSQAILDFVNAVETERKDEMHSFILMRHGSVVAQGWWSPYNPESTHMLYSLSKSFTSTAIGLAQEEGLLSINDQVISFFPEETPEEPSDNLKAMRIRDLLKMNTGHNNDATWGMRQDTTSWVKGFLSLPVEHKPGTHFVYNSAATFMLSAIIQKVSGKTVFDYLTPRLFEPLGIENAWWETNMNGINVGGWGLNVRTGDIASFGQLYLQKGNWEGKQLIPESWIEEATSFQTSNGSNPESDWEQGYGYQFWRCRHNIYRGDGAFGQYCIVMPEQDAVLAITSGTTDMQSILNLIWKHLLPAMSDEPVAENETLYKELQDKLASLKLSSQEGEKSSSLENEALGAYTMTENRYGITTISLNDEGDGKSITISYENDSYTFPFGFGESKNGECRIGNWGEQVISTSAAWVAEDTLRVKTYLYETPYNATFDLAFSENMVTINGKPNVAFGRIEVKGWGGVKEK